MAGVRQSLCLICQARQSVFGRRRLLAVTKRRPQTTVSTQPESDGFLLREPERQEIVEDGPTLGMAATLRQWTLHSPIDELREAALGFDALWKSRDLRLEVLRNLSNPWPEARRGRQYHPRSTPSLPEAKAAVVPHETFRREVREAIGAKPIRQVLRRQLLRCERPREILRVVSVAMQSRDVAENLAISSEPLMRALYRCRQTVSDPEVFSTLNIIITRFLWAELPVEPVLFFMALKFAARSRSLPGMKKYLKLIREQGLTLTSNVFRSVVAKFSIGYRGLGEIRNGRWCRKDLLQVLHGFDDAEHLPPEQRYHFGSFLDRTDWTYLHGWVAVLARCKDSDSVWKEWEIWRESNARKKPRLLAVPGSNRVMTSRLRGEYWFIEQMTYSGDLDKAWKLFEESDIKFTSLKDNVQDRLLQSVEYATKWHERLRTAMIRKYDRDLSKIEKAFGVKWVASWQDGEGQHELYMDQEEALDALGQEGWRLDDDYGFPWETSPIVPEGERALHDAVEDTAIADIAPARDE